MDIAYVIDRALRTQLFLCHLDSSVGLATQIHELDPVYDQRPLWVNTRHISSNQANGDFRPRVAVQSSGKAVTNQIR